MEDGGFPADADALAVRDTVNVTAAGSLDLLLLCLEPPF